jgi:hypothetical protein
MGSRELTDKALFKKDKNGLSSQIHSLRFHQDHSRRAPPLPFLPSLLFSFFDNFSIRRHSHDPNPNAFKSAACAFCPSARPITALIRISLVLMS